MEHLHDVREILNGLSSVQFIVEQCESLSVETACGVLQDLNNARLKIVAEKQKILESASKDKAKDVSRY